MALIADENTAPSARIEPDENQESDLPPKKRKATFNIEPMIGHNVIQKLKPEDVSVITSANKRVKVECPKMHQNLMRCLFGIRSNNATVAGIALEQLYVLLEQEGKYDGITQFLYRTYGQVDVRNSSKRHPHSLPVQYWSLNVLGSLSYSKRLRAIGFGQESALKQSIISIGVLDQIKSSLDAFPNDAEMTGVLMGVLNNFFDLYTFTELFDFGFLPLVVEKLQRFPNKPNVQYVGSAALLTAAKAKNATRSKLQSIHSVSALAEVLERFNKDKSKDGVWVYEKADAAMKAVLSLEG